jgi:hypothetical protein
MLVREITRFFVTLLLSPNPNGLGTVSNNLVFTMKIKLPKKILKYVSWPSDPMVALDLFIEWRVFLRRMRDPDFAPEAKVDYMEKVLGGTFNIPPNHWSRFIPTPSQKSQSRPLSPTQLAEKIQKLMKPLLQPKPKVTRPLGKERAAFKPKVIVRRNGEEIKRA